MRPWAWIALLLATIGCAARSAERMPAPSTYDTLDSYSDAEYDAPAAEPMRKERSVALAQKPDAPPPPAKIEPVPVPQRMVHYDGFARMRATRPSDTVDEIAQLAVDAGGRVDRLTDTQATVRVPVDRFDEIWAAVLALGDVLTKQVRADDVTDQFRATDLRVRTLKTMRKRLVTLLGRARSEEEKLALLQEITRVTEELDRTESQLRVLRDLASMSRISVDVVPRELGVQRGALTLDGFEWIRALSPFNRGVFGDDKRVELRTPDEMVTLSRTGPWIAESPDRTVLWTMRLDNDPRGDAAFWRSAIDGALADDFAGVTSRDVGDYACTSFDEPGADEPYRWLVCVATTDRHVRVVQAYFPGPEQVERFAERVDQALVGGGEA